MNLERRRVVRAMESMGWIAHKNGKFWEFRQPDTNGWWDHVKVNQQNLSWNWLRQHDQDFSQFIMDRWEEYYPDRFRKTIEEIQE